jgi:hypothetical protein
MNDLLKVYRYNLNNAGMRTDPVIGKDIVQEMNGDIYIYIYIYIYIGTYPFGCVPDDELYGSAGTRRVACAG